tara:strand:- start:6788 stop:7729 length:942 start_codon:yes stop_codon:yes gene_type:complete
MNKFKKEIEYQDSIELFANIFGYIRFNHEDINAQCREISVSFLNHIFSRYPFEQENDINEKIQDKYLEKYSSFSKYNIYSQNLQTQSLRHQTSFLCKIISDSIIEQRKKYSQYKDQPRNLAYILFRENQIRNDLMHSRVVYSNDKSIYKEIEIQNNLRTFREQIDKPKTLDSINHDPGEISSKTIQIEHLQKFSSIQSKIKNFFMDLNRKKNIEINNSILEVPLFDLNIKYWEEKDFEYFYSTFKKLEVYEDIQLVFENLSFQSSKNNKNLKSPAPSIHADDIFDYKYNPMNNANFTEEEINNLFAKKLNDKD